MFFSFLLGVRCEGSLFLEVEMGGKGGGLLCYNRTITYNFPSLFF